jgi:hypothetical protein
LPFYALRSTALRFAIEERIDLNLQSAIVQGELTMNCWHCERPAHGACIFCGRAICKEHVREMPHIVALYRDAKNTQKAIVTARALFCGVCEPREDPVEIPELK